MRATSCDPQLPKAEGSEMDEADKSIAELRRTHFPKGSKFPEEGMEFLRAEHTGSRLGFKAREVWRPHGDQLTVQYLLRAYGRRLSAGGVARLPYV